MHLLLFIGKWKRYRHYKFQNCLWLKTDNKKCYILIQCGEEKIGLFMFNVNLSFMFGILRVGNSILKDYLI